MNAAATFGGTFGFPDEGPSRPIQEIKYVPVIPSKHQTNPVNLPTSQPTPSAPVAKNVAPGNFKLRSNGQFMNLAAE
jgi:hypothetical protein